MCMRPSRLSFFSFEDQDKKSKMSLSPYEFTLMMRRRRQRRRRKDWFDIGLQRNIMVGTADYPGTDWTALSPPASIFVLISAVCISHVQNQ